MRLLLLTVLLSGCVAVGQEQIADNSYRLRFEHSFGEPQSGAASGLHARAAELCPSGYEKLQERANGGMFSGYTEWTIRCD